MNRKPLLCVMVVCAWSIAAAAGGEEEKPSKNTLTKCFAAQHGYDGGLKAMVDLSKREGFGEVKTMDELAAFAAKVPGAIGFTAHPGFVGGKRHAHAVLWYTRRSKLDQSWQLHLFDAAEARKQPGEAAKPEALIAAERQVSEKLATAEVLIKDGGAGGVRFPEGLDYDERKVRALAVMHLGGFFAHTGQFGKDGCWSCRSVVPGGIPEKCALGVNHLRHWNCCGAEAGVSRCRYWELIKAQDDVGARE